MKLCVTSAADTLGEDLTTAEVAAAAAIDVIRGRFRGGRRPPADDAPRATVDDVLNVLWYKQMAETIGRKGRSFVGTGRAEAGGRGKAELLTGVAQSRSSLPL